MINIITKIVLLLAFLFYVNYAYPENTYALDSSNYKYVNMIGAGFGFTTGIGMSYRLIINDYGIQTNLFCLHQKHFSAPKLKYSFGISFIKYLKHKPRTSFYLYQANHVTNLFVRRYQTSMEQLKIANNHGLGVGVEYNMLEKISFNFMIGAAYYVNAQTIPNFAPTIEIAYFYRF